MKARMWGLVVVVLVALGASPVLAGDGPTVEWWVVANGGGTASNGDVVVNDTVGQPVIGAPATNGDVTLSSGFWVGCTAAAAVVPTLGAARDGNDIRLTWPDDNETYQVWVSTNPYVNPDEVLPTTTIGDPFYLDVGAAGSLENHFYVVRGVNACGAASASSTRKGEFTFGLTRGS